MRKQIALPILAIFIGLAIAPPNFALAQGRQNNMESHDKMTTDDMASDKINDNSKMSNQK